MKAQVLIRALLVLVFACTFFGGAHPVRANGTEAYPRYLDLSDDASINNRYVRVGRYKSLVVQLPREAGDVLVSNPEIADAVLRTATRLYVIGVEIGQASIFLFDRAGEEIASLDIQVDGDLSGLQRILNEAVPNGNVMVEAINSSIVLTGNVPSALDSKRAEEVTALALEKDQLAGGGFAARGEVINLLTVSGSDQVTLKVTIAEVRREVVRQLGINGSALINSGSLGVSLVNPSLSAANFANLVSSSVDLSYSGSNFSLDAVIRALEETNMVKMLAEPTLTAVSGESASFLAGGEYPGIRSISPGGIESESFVTTDDAGNVSVTQTPGTRRADQIEYSFERVGVSLDFLPVVLSGGRISLRIRAEVSDFVLDGAARLQGGFGQGYVLPPISTRRAQTTVEVPSGGSFMIGGLVKENTRRAINGFPGLMRIPILGNLFSSKDFQRSESELVIIVTPYLVKPVGPNQLTTPTENLAVSSDARGLFMGQLTRTYGGGGAPDGKSYRGPIGFDF